MTAESPAPEGALQVVSPGPTVMREWAPLIESLRTGAAARRGSDEPSRRTWALVLPPPDVGSWEVERQALNVELDRVLDGDGPVERVFILSSMRATGATERSAGFATEDQAVVPSDPVARQWQRFETDVTARVAGRTNVESCVLRVCFIEGVPGSDARLLEGSTVWTWLGFDPPIQVLPVEAVVDALWSLASVSRGALPPLLHVAPDDAVPLSRWLRRRGQRRIPVPGWISRTVSVGRGGGAEARRLLQRPATLDNRRLRRTLQRESFHAMSEPDAPYDGMGWKRSAEARLGRWCMEPLRRAYWRVSDHGAEHVPRTGPTLLVGIHRGYVPLDAMMLLHLVRLRAGRTVRFLIHPALLKWPFLANLFPSIGGLVASKANAERVLSSGGMLGVFPEGANAAMIETRNAYPLQPFLSDDFARWAVRWNASVVPVAMVGPAEALPIFRRVRWRWWRRHTGWPTFPLGFLFPFGPPIPLPTKWHILFLEPIAPEDFEHEDEGERALALARTVRAQLDAAVQDLLRRRSSIWRGSLESEAD